MVMIDSEEYWKDWRTYKVGDLVEYWSVNHKGERSQGTVIAFINLPGYSYPHYIIETPCQPERLLVIRSGFILEMRLAK